MSSTELVLPIQANVGANIDVIQSVNELVTTYEGNDDKQSTSQLYVCQHCKKGFANEKFLIRHLKRKCVQEENMEKPHKCEHCPLSFSKKRQWSNHMLSHSGLRPFKCDKCEKTFLTKGHLKRHYVVHLSEDEIPYKCELCGKAFAWPSLLESHKKLHNGEKRFKCGICARMFSHASTLNVHITNRHLVDGFFHCIVCKEKFKDISELKSHMLSHDSDKSMKCERCADCFSTLKDLETHVCVNFGGHPLLCQLCSVEFENTDSFCTHPCLNDTSIRICGCCKKEFKSIWHLREHLITHCAEKPFECQHCEMSFRRKRELNIHLTKHTASGNQYKCKLCESTFTAENYLKQHMRVEHRRKTHECTICGHLFMFPSALKTHMDFHYKTGNKKFGKKNHRGNELFIPGLAEKLESTKENGEKTVSNSLAENDEQSSNVNSISTIATSTNLYGNSQTNGIPDVGIQSDTSTVVSSENEKIDALKNIEETNVFTVLSNENEKISDDVFTEKIQIDPSESLFIDNFNHGSISYDTLEIAEVQTITLEKPIEKTNPVTQQLSCNDNLMEKDLLTGKTFFRCPLCLNIFTTYSEILRHQKDAHSIGKEYQCEICGRQFPIAANLSKHMNLHKKSKNDHKYTCRYCGNHFKVIYKLREHLRFKHDEINNHHLTDLELHMQHGKDKNLATFKNGVIQNDIINTDNISLFNPFCVQNDSNTLLLNDLLIHQGGTNRLMSIHNIGLQNILQMNGLSSDTTISLTEPQALSSLLSSNSDFDMNSINNTDISFIGNHVVQANGDSLL